jgi:hypothetical protein
MFSATFVPTRRRLGPVLAALALVPGLGGCITVKAPDKPIVIELNVTIKQEVIYRLAGDAAQTIDKNAEIF